MKTKVGCYNCGVKAISVHGSVPVKWCKLEKLEENDDTGKQTYSVKFFCSNACLMNYCHCVDNGDEE